MKKLTSFFLWVLVVAPWAGAWDLGLTETEASVALLPKPTAPVFTQTSKTTAYLDLPLGNFSLRAEGIADISVVYASAANPALSVSDLRLDVGVLNLSGFLSLGQDSEGNGLGVLDIALGRKSVSDLTGGWLLGGKMDGASLSFLSGKFHLDTKAYYTGLVLKKNSKVGLGSADAKDSSDATVLFAPSRIVGALNLGLNEVILRQDLQWENLGTYDLRATGPVHGAYSTLGISGPAIMGFRHQSSVTGELVLTGALPSYGILAASQWSANLPFGRLVVDGAYARGLVDSGSVFVPIAGKGLASVTSLSTANGAEFGADLSFKPLPKVNTGLKGDALFRADPSQAVGLAGFQSGSTAVWLGAEASWYGSWSVSSELNLGWTFGAFVPNTDAVVAATPPTYLAVLTATLDM